MEDIKILEYIKSGNDRKVIDQLYSDIFPFVNSYVKGKKGKVQEAEDCFQEAITKFYQQVLKGEFDTKYRIHGYIYSISVRLWINYIKRENRKTSLDLIQNDYSSYETDIYENEVYVEKRQLIMQLLEQVGEKCKELLYQFIFTDLVNEDIMHRYGYSSIASVKMQHKRCKQKMIEVLKASPEIEIALRK